MPVRFLKSSLANPFDLAWVQPSKGRGMISRGSAQCSLTVIEDDQKEWCCSPAKPRLPNGAQQCCRRGDCAFGDSNFERVRAVAESKTDRLEALRFWQAQWTEFVVGEEAHKLLNRAVANDGMLRI
jgi:hypothetical protein